MPKRKKTLVFRKEREITPKTGKKSAGAIVSLIFGLCFWIPLINILFSPFAIYFGVKALYNINKHPKEYGGAWMAIVGLLLGGIVLIFTLLGLGMCLLGYKDICTSLGLKFLA